jgi:hypothetical protein
MTSVRNRETAVNPIAIKNPNLSFPSKNDPT